MHLNCGNAVVRSWSWRDVENLSFHSNNRKVWRNARDSFPYPFTIEEANRWISYAVETKPENNFAITVNDQAIGCFTLTINTDVYRKSAEIGYWIGEAFWGQGITTNVVRTITPYIFKNYDLCRLYARVFAWNPPSMRVLEKAGYVMEGRMRKFVFKDDQLVDEVLYAAVN